MLKKQWSWSHFKFFGHVKLSIKQPFIKCEINPPLQRAFHAIATSSCEHPTDEEDPLHISLWGWGRDKVYVDWIKLTICSQNWYASYDDVSRICVTYLFSRVCTVSWPAPMLAVDGKESLAFIYVYNRHNNTDLVITRTSSTSFSNIQQWRLNVISLTSGQNLETEFSLLQDRASGLLFPPISGTLPTCHPSNEP